MPRFQQVTDDFEEKLVMSEDIQMKERKKGEREESGKNPLCKPNKMFKIWSCPWAGREPSLMAQW